MKILLKQTNYFFLLSSDVFDRLKNLNKNIIMYYSEIKEIIARKYCFCQIAYEIFMKDGRSYFFNFFSKKNREIFYNSLRTKVTLLNGQIKQDKFKENKSNYFKYDWNFANILIIDDLKTYFENKEYKLKYIKSEISNFQYLLLVNKFCCRSYNECNQYLIFPLLYMDTKTKRKRNLSKPICMNKELNKDDIEKYRNNFESVGYHFNNHYSANSYILFYLMRVIPFTYNQIKFQSGSFDAPSRLFSSVNNLLTVFKTSDENRELIPELFYSYESFYNLNYNDFGFSKTDNKQINNLNTIQNIGIVEFIIDLRKILENSELSGWINNIFGSNQYNNNIDSYNTFPEYSYENYNDFTQEKQKLFSEIGEDELSGESKTTFNDRIKELKNEIQLLSLGLTPSQLFKHPHPIKKRNSKNFNNSKIENIIDNNKKESNFKKRKSNNFIFNRELFDFMSKISLNKLLFSFDNNDNGHSKILFVFENQINIFNLLEENEKYSYSTKIDLDEEAKILNIKPYKNNFVELYRNAFLLCRLTNRTMLLYSKENQKIYIEWPCVVTSIEFYSHDEINLIQTRIHLNKIIVGDEEGTLSLIEIETKYHNKELNLNSLTYIHKRYKTFYSYINGLIYNNSLNIIISSCNQGYISINNGFSFEILNIIEIENFHSLLDFKLSEYNLLYFYTIKNIGDRKKYELYCYTLNGLKVSKLCLEEDLINFLTYKDIITTINKNGDIYEYNCANLKKIEGNLNKEDIEDIKEKGQVIYGMMNTKLNNIFIFLNKELKIIRVNKEM